MTPVFPTKTFPNHYTIVTGLLPGKHGIIANDFWDSDLQESFLESGLKKKDPRFWGGEPVCFVVVVGRFARKGCSRL